MRKRSMLGLIIVLGCFMPACGVGDENVWESGDWQFSDGKADSANPAFFDGKWAMRLVMAGQNAGSLLTVDTLCVSYNIMTMSQTGSQVTGSIETCELLVSSSPSLVKLSVTDAYLASIPHQEIQFKTEKKSYGYKLLPFDFLQIAGANLDDPVNNELPSEKDDPRVFDQDGDGEPGITYPVQVKIGLISFKGEIYVVQRLAMQLKGKTDSQNSLVGEFTDWSLEQNIIDASKSIFKVKQDNISDLENSFFEAKRLDDSWTCQDLLDYKADLFGE